MLRKRQIKPDVNYFPPTLMEKIENVRRYPLTFLEAPSGFGKTTAMQHFLKTGLSETVVVYTHKFIEEEGSRLWRQFSRVIERFDKDSGEKLLTIGSLDEDTLPEIKQVLQSLSCEEETYLFLDDLQFGNWYHPGEFLMSLSEHGCEQLHIIVAAHPYPREEQKFLVESNRMWLLRDTDFVFSRNDVEAYYNKVGIVLTEGQLDEILYLTGGWVIALYLQMKSLLRSGSFEQGGMAVLLEKTFWGSLKEKEKQFLLEISIFSQFTLGQAAEFAGLSLRQTEHMLMEKRFFIRFNQDSRSYYMHTQLRKLLAAQFDSLPDAQKRQIYLKGGKLAEKAGERSNTLRFYYLAGAWEDLLAMPLTSYEIVDVIDETTTPMILDVLENTPREMKIRYCKALVPLTFTLFFLGKNEELFRKINELEEIIAESKLSKQEKRALYGELELLMSFLEYNRIDDMSRRHKKALKLLQGPATLISVRSTWTFGSPSVLYMFWRESGKLEEELSQLDECMPDYYRLTNGHGTGAEHVMRGEAMLHRGEVEQAEVYCYRGIFTANSKCQNSISQCGVFALARIAVLKGDRQGFVDCCDMLKKYAHKNTEDLCRYTYDLADGYLSLLMGKTERIAPWLLEGKIDNHRLVVMSQPFAYIIYGQVLLQKKEYVKLLGLSEFVLGLSLILPNLLPQIYMKLYMSQAFAALGQQGEAKIRLEEALGIAVPDRVFLPFAENYNGIKKLLPLTDCAGKVQTEILKLSRKLTDGLGMMEGARLTRREKEVLECLKQDLKYQEIAKRLFISMATVKKHIQKIYVKYRVSSKSQLMKKLSK